MSAQTARSRPLAEAASVQMTESKVDPEGTRRAAFGHPLAEVHAFGYQFVVTARTGRRSSQVIVTRCPFHCGSAHRFTAQPWFDIGRRKAPCTGAPFVLHALPQTGEAA